MSRDLTWDKIADFIAAEGPFAAGAAAPAGLGRAAGRVVVPDFGLAATSAHWRKASSSRLSWTVSRPRFPSGAAIMRPWLLPPGIGTGRLFSADACLSRFFLVMAGSRGNRFPAFLKTLDILARGCKSS